MKKFSVLSARHFSWLFKANDSFISLKNLIFLVKDPVTKVFTWTQFYSTSHKPIKAYLHGFDITSYLTHRSQLTRYSYYFLNYVYSIGFTVRDVRSYFNAFKRISSAEPDTKLLAERGVRSPYKKSQVAVRACTSAEAARNSGVPMDITSVGYKLYKKFEDNPGSTTIQRSVVCKKFEDDRLFSTAWKLACANLLPFKFADSKLELCMRLKNAGLGPNVLSQLRDFIEDRFPNVDYIALVNDMARQFGFSISAAYAGAERIQNHFTLYDVHERGMTAESLPSILFPDHYVLPLARK